MFIGFFAFSPDAAALSLTGPTELAGANGFGCRVGAAGDTNGDGYADLAVTDCASDIVQVYFGSASGITSTVTTLSGEGGGAYGYALSGGGDLNGDGYDDLVIGAPDARGTRGCVYVVYGSASGPVNAATPLRCGLTIGQTLGGNVDIVGDVNGDGYDDMAWSPRSGTGRLGIHHGGAGGVAATPSRTLPLDGYVDDTGEGLRGAGDVNGDGFDDVVIGCPTLDGSSGSLRVYYGSVIGLTGGNQDQLDLAEYMGLEWPYWWGHAVDGAGDVDGDGYGDLVVGNAGYDGFAWLVYGSATGVSWSSVNFTRLSYVGYEWYSTLGRSVAGGGDYNADGYPDPLAGQMTANGSADTYFYNSHYVWEGGPDLDDLDPWGDMGAYDYSGYSVASLGDVDGDGCDDFAAGWGYPAFWEGEYDYSSLDGGVYLFYGYAVACSLATEAPAER